MGNQTPHVQIKLSLDELKSLIHKVVREALLEVLGEDSKTEPNFAPEIVERLRRYKVQPPVTYSLDELEAVLGLDD